MGILTVFFVLTVVCIPARLCLCLYCTFVVCVCVCVCVCVYLCVMKACRCVPSSGAMGASLAMLRKMRKNATKCVMSPRSTTGLRPKRLFIIPNTPPPGHTREAHSYLHA